MYIKKMMMRKDEDFFFVFFFCFCAHFEFKKFDERKVNLLLFFGGLMR